MARYKGEFLILFSTVAWGFSYLFTITSLQSLDALNVIALRYSIACMVTALAFGRHLLRIGRKEFAYGCLLGALLSISSSCLAVGLKTTSISNAGFIIGSMVLFVAMLDAAITRKKPQPGLIVGIILALAGIGILTLRGQLSINPGDLYCLASTLALTVHVMVAQRAAHHAAPVGASIVQFAVAGALAWAASLMTGPVVLLPGGAVLWAVLGLGIVGTAAAFVCQVAGQKFISPTRTAFLFTLEPVFATLFAWLFLREQVTWHVYAGGGLLLSGVYISEYRSSSVDVFEQREIPRESH